MPLVAGSAQAMSRQQVTELFERYRRDHDPADLERLVLRFLPLARHLARRYAGGAETEDLEQVACVALLKAIERFDPGRGVAFTSFAFPTLTGELKRYFRDQGWAVRVPRSLQELGARVSVAAEDLESVLGRAPTVAEVAGRCGVSAEEVVEARALGSAHRPDSLDRPVGPEEDRPVANVLASEETGYARAERAADLERLLQTLTPREQEVIRLRFTEDLVQRDIAAQLGLSQMHVSRIIRQAITRLRDAHDARGPA
jgi:RNA polymerase sigma-B factor